jgi:glycosyltransferase involved in cell wall biosynthesis
LNGPALEAAPARHRLKVLQVDPSLFTAPYDAALSRGLRTSGIDVVWASRSLRPGEEDALRDLRRPLFYRWTDGPRRRSGSLWKLLKGVEHGLGLAGLAKLADRSGIDLVHFQWALVPRLDRHAIGWLRRRRPVVWTVHDVTPLNGARSGGAQVSGFDDLLGAVDALIVHMPTGKQALVERGVPADRVHVVPHGMLPLPSAVPEARRPGRWRLVLFGRLQAYKGADVAIEALGRVPATAREGIELVIAGEPMIDVEPLRRRISALGLDANVDLRPQRLDETAMASLLRSADAFVFPYRTIEASGVLHLVAELGGWIIASDLGCFRALLGTDAGAGELVPPGDADALADAITRSVGMSPSSAPASDLPDWNRIGLMTRAVYQAAFDSWRSSPPAA